MFLVIKHMGYPLLMNNHEELMNLDYVVYDHVSDFIEEVSKRDFIEPVIKLGFFYKEETPVLDVTAKDLLEGEYSKEYRLEGLSPEAFEEDGYDVWTEGFEDSFESVEQVGRLLE